MALPSRWPLRRWSGEFPLQTAPLPIAALAGYRRLTPPGLAPDLGVLRRSGVAALDEERSDHQNISESVQTVEADSMASVEQQRGQHMHGDGR